MSTRNARAGFFALAVLLVLDVVHLLLVQRLVLGAQTAGSSLSDLTRLLEVLDYVWYVLLLGQVGAAFIAGQLPAGTRARPFMHGVAFLYLLQLAVHASQRTLLESAKVDSFKTITTAVWTTTEALALVITVLAGVAIDRIGTAAGAKGARTVAIATTAPRLFFLVLALNSLVFPASLSGTLATITGWLMNLAVVVNAAGFAWTAWTLGRLRADSVAPIARANAELPADWRRVMSGIYTYLVAVVLRILVLLFSYLTVASANSADTFESYSRTHAVHDSIITLGIVGGLASIVMIGGVVMITRAPAENVRGPAMTTVVCMFLGLIVDAVTTSMTAAAFSSVSDAFAAMELLPVLSAVGTGLGVFGAFSLLRSLAAAGDEIGLPDVAARAKGAGTVVLLAGLLGAAAQLAIKHVPAPLAIVLAIVVGPMILFAAIQLVRVMLAVASTIQERAADR